MYKRQALDLKVYNRAASLIVGVDRDDVMEHMMAGDSGVSLDQTSQDTAKDVDMPALNRESNFNFV